MNSWRSVQSVMDSDIDDNPSSVYSSHDDSGWDSSTAFDLRDRRSSGHLVGSGHVHSGFDDILQDIFALEEQFQNSSNHDRDDQGREVGDFSPDSSVICRRLDAARAENEKLRKALAKARRDKLKLRSKLFIRNKQLKKYRRWIKRTRTRPKSGRDKPEASTASSSTSEIATSSTIINVYINPAPAAEPPTATLPIASSSKKLPRLDANTENDDIHSEDTKAKTGGSIYPRDCCGSQFLDKHAYYRHKRKLHDKKTWPCDYCDMKLSTSHNLKRHMKKAHGNEINGQPKDIQ